MQISRQPGALVATSGRPQAAASIRPRAGPRDARAEQRYGSAPQRDDVVDMAEPGDARRFVQAWTSSREMEAGFAGSGLPAMIRLRSCPSLTQELMGRDQRADALVEQKAARKADCYWSIRLGQGLQAVSVDAGAWNQRGAARALRRARSILGDRRNSAPGRCLPAVQQPRAAARSWRLQQARAQVTDVKM